MHFFRKLEREFQKLLKRQKSMYSKAQNEIIEPASCVEQHKDKAAGCVGSKVAKSNLM
jgi:hypothetical protein